MKKSLFLMGAAILCFASSCTTTTLTKTATTADVSSQLLSATVADLVVAPERISATLITTPAIRRGGLANVRRAVEAEALRSYKDGNYDVLVALEYIVEQKDGKVSSITVTGRPAYYTNFRSLNDSVWCNPVFRAGYTDNTLKKSQGLFKWLFK